MNDQILYIYIHITRHISRVTLIIVINTEKPIDINSFKFLNIFLYMLRKEKNTFVVNAIYIVTVKSYNQHSQ